MHLKPVSLFLLLASLLLLGPEQSGWSQSRTKTAQTRKTAVPAGMIPASEAVKRINAHIKTIEDLKAALRKDYNFSTFDNRFVWELKRRNVPLKQLNADWGANSLGLTIGTGAEFYDHHREALIQSRYPVMFGGKPYMSQADLDYLDRGMQALQTAHETMQFAVDKMVEHAADKAYFLHESNKAAMSGNNAYWESQKAMWRKKADLAGKIWSDRAKNIREFRNKRVFSAVTAPDRVPVPESTPNTISEGTDESALID